MAEHCIVSPWINLFSLYVGKYSPSENDRVFRAFTGVCPEVAEFVFLKYKHFSELPNRFVLLIVLHFLKTMPNEDIASCMFGICRNTYRDKLWRAVTHLNLVMSEINIEERLEGPVCSTGMFKNVRIIVDGTDCPIFTPGSKAERLAHKSGRKKDNLSSAYNLKYTIGVHIRTGRILCTFGPTPGAVHDITAVRDAKLIAYIVNEDATEMILADKGYIGEPIFIRPHKANRGHNLTAEEEVFNTVLASARQMVECSIQRLKIFGVLGRSGKFTRNHDKHTQVFNICAQITNISLERNPVWLAVNQYLLAEV